MVKSYSPLLWGVIAIAVGVTLVIWQEAVMQLMVLILGVLSLVGSAASLLGFMITKKRDNRTWNQMPVMAFVGILWGILLLVKPEMWVNVSMVVVGLTMVFVALNQMMGLRQQTRAGVSVRWGYYIFPVLLMVAGVVSVFNPAFLAAWIMVFMGVWIMMYGLTELVAYFAFYGRKR